MSVKNSYNILFTDDDKLTHKILKYMLCNHQYLNFFDAYDGIEAIDIVSQNNIDLILMDIQMPIMDGVTATKQIYKTYPNMPIISISAYDSKTEYDGIFTNHIRKPIDRNLLIDIIHNQLHIELPN